jgi:flagellar assembly factor FliW
LVAGLPICLLIAFLQLLLILLHILSVDAETDSSLQIVTDPTMLAQTLFAVPTPSALKVDADAEKDTLLLITMQALLIADLLIHLLAPMFFATKIEFA